jgi:3-oxoacyl-[acyl-carrier protein] reductase
MSTSTLPLAGKVALVTGGSKGIGRATSLRLARDGAKVVVNYASSSKDADEVVSLIGSEQAIAIKADVGNVEEIGKLIDAAVAKWGKIDILIACAGIMRLNELEKVTEAEFDLTFNLNVKGPMFLTQVSFTGFESHGIETNWITASCSSHGSWVSRCAIFYDTMPRQYRHAKLPHLYRFQGSDRANDTSSFERSCSQRHFGQLLCARSYCH